MKLRFSLLALVVMFCSALLLRARVMRMPRGSSAEMTA
jgi:hypothetical protein